MHKRKSDTGPEASIWYTTLFIFSNCRMGSLQYFYFLDLQR